ncbi:uncharacterized protein BX663DRAFT_418034, partial [Cokeromyces recurvatus]|uniref:uncharacterized protein n=1 Tax=Cokeromyces recurvatus TaxID=90255 RepID=UPI00221F4F0D
MRLSVTLALATAVAVSAQNCNPTYNVASSGECFTNCNIKTGQKYLSGWTMDHTSPLFIDSLNLMCTKGTAEYLAFMSEAGICMSRCPDNPALFADEFAGACAWYAQHKNDTCTDSPNTTNTTIASSSTTNSSPSNSS